MQEEDEKYKNYKAYLSNILIILTIFFIFTDNFLKRYIKTRVEQQIVSYGLYAKNIKITSNIKYNIDKIKQLVPKNQSIFTLDLHNLYNSIIRIPEIKTAKIKRKLFNSVDINLELYEPIAIILENSLLLCKDGTIIKNYNNVNKLTSIGGINYKKNFLNLYKKIKKYNLDITNNIKNINFNSKDIEIKFNNGKIATLKYNFKKQDLLKQLTK